MERNGRIEVNSGTYLLHACCRLGKWRTRLNEIKDRKVGLYESGRLN